MRRRVLLWLAWLGLAASLIGLLARYLTPGSEYVLGAATFSGYLALGALVAVLLFALARSRAGWVGCALSGAVVVWTVGLHLPEYVAESVPPHGRDLVVMTANLRVGSADAASVVAAVRSRHVDVLMLEELTVDEDVRLRTAGLWRVLPYAIADPRLYADGTGLWSRQPLTETRVFRQLGFSFVTARLSGAAVTVAAVHVYGPYPSPQFPRWYQDMQSYPALLGGLRGRTILVGGDFNATADDEQFRAILARGYADAAEQAGAGFTPTWPADRWFPPLIAIDHVLTRGAVARSVDSVEIPGSDHRALIAVVRLPTRG
ncbi:MAG TPA: endonuclease/exonuclease/phosphatase family protein [Jatrophihabitans sp.]|jgi:endonuclease/exonuclease/phosphatase (EEP) superfamily protein YafD